MHCAVFEFPSAEYASFLFDSVQFPFSPVDDIEDRLKSLGFVVDGQPENVTVEYYDFESWDLAKEGRFYAKTTFQDGSKRQEGKIASEIGGEFVFMKHPISSVVYIKEEFKRITICVRRVIYEKGSDRIMIEDIQSPFNHKVCFFTGNVRNVPIELYTLMKNPERDAISEYLFRHIDNVYKELETIDPKLVYK